MYMYYVKKTMNYNSRPDCLMLDDELINICNITIEKEKLTFKNLLRYFKSKNCSKLKIKKGD